MHSPGNCNTDEETSVNNAFVYEARASHSLCNKVTILFLGFPGTRDILLVDFNSKLVASDSYRLFCNFKEEKLGGYYRKSGTNDYFKIQNRGQKSCSGDEWSPCFATAIVIAEWSTVIFGMNEG